MLALFKYALFEAIAKSAVFQVEVQGNRHEQLTQTLTVGWSKTRDIFIDPINGELPLSNPPDCLQSVLVLTPWTAA